MQDIWIIGPSNGRVNEPVVSTGILVHKISRFEGSGYLGGVINYGNTLYGISMNYIF